MICNFIWGEKINNVVKTIPWDCEGTDIDNGIWIGFNVDPATVEIITAAYFIGTMINSLVSNINNLKTIEDNLSNFDKYYATKLTQIIVTGIVIVLTTALAILYILLSVKWAAAFCLVFTIVSCVALTFETIVYVSETTNLNKCKKCISSFKKQDLFDWSDKYSKTLLKYIIDRYAIINSSSPISDKKTKAIEILGTTTQPIRQKITSLILDPQFNDIYGKEINQDAKNYLNRFNDGDLYNQDFWNLVNGPVGLIALISATITIITTFIQYGNKMNLLMLNNYIRTNNFMKKLISERRVKF